MEKNNLFKLYIIYQNNLNENKNKLNINLCF